MTGESITKPTNHTLSTYAYPFSLYFIAVATLYLWGYWSPFNVNILEYLTITDIVKITALPITSALAFIVVAVILGEFSRSKKPISESGTAAFIGTFLYNNSRLVSLLYAIGVMLVLLLAPSNMARGVIPVLLAIPLSCYLSHIRLFHNLISSENHRWMFTYLFSILPFLAFSHGNGAAYAILNGEKYDYALSVIDGIQTLGSNDISRQPRFLGHAGDHLFFWEPQKALLIISRPKEGKSLILRRYENKQN